MSTRGEPPAGPLAIADLAQCLKASRQWSITALKAIGGSAEIVIREMFCKLKKIITPDVISRASKQRGTKEEESGFKFKIECVLKCPLMDTYMSEANSS